MKQIILAALIAFAAIVLVNNAQARDRTGEAIVGAAIILGLSIAAAKAHSNRRHRRNRIPSEYYDPYGEYYYDRGSRHYHYRGRREYRDWRHYGE